MVSSQDLSFKQIEQPVLNNISHKSWKFCRKLTSLTPLTEWGLLMWVGSFPYHGMEHPLEW